MSNRLEESLMLEAEFQSLCSNSPDTHEAVRAFMEKREPDFTGLDG
jgi:enoyl-CoA hydratase/carnithine racemase